MEGKGAHLHNKWCTFIMYIIFLIVSNLNFSIQVKHYKVYEILCLLGMYACVYRVSFRIIILGRE